MRRLPAVFRICLFAIALRAAGEEAVAPPVPEIAKPYLKVDKPAVPENLKAIVGLVKDTKLHTHVRISAIAAIGQFGQAADIGLIEEVMAGADQRIVTAGKAARAKLAEKAPAQENP